MMATMKATGVCPHGVLDDVCWTCTAERWPEPIRSLEPICDSYGRFTIKVNGEEVFHADDRKRFEDGMRCLQAFHERHVRGD